MQPPRGAAPTVTPDRLMRARAVLVTLAFGLFVLSACKNEKKREGLSPSERLPLLRRVIERAGAWGREVREASAAAR